MKPSGEENTTMNDDTVGTQCLPSFFEIFLGRVLKGSSDAYKLACNLDPPEQPNLALGTKSSGEEHAAVDCDAVGVQRCAGAIHALLRGVVKSSAGALEIPSNLRPRQAHLAIRGEFSGEENITVNLDAIGTQRLPGSFRIIFRRVLEC